MDPLVSVITPVGPGRSPALLERAIRCLDAQTLQRWEHLVCFDGPASEAPPIFASAPGPAPGDRRRFLVTQSRLGGYGARVRNWAMPHAAGKYLCFLDDDNIIFPDYLERLAGALVRARDEKFAICRIVHMGPLPPELGAAPIYLAGSPQFRRIDTLQVMVDAEAMRSVGWLEPDHYCSDGFTYEELGRRFGFVRVEECLGIHM